VKRAPLVVLCLVLAGVFVALGIWQVERRAWKLGLIARVDARLHAPAQPLPPRSAWGRDLAYRRVRLAGSFLHGSETLVQAVTARGAGWWVLTPLRTAGGIVLVNRGFVPQERRTPASRREGQVAGRVVVSGLIRTSEPGGAFLRSNDPVGDRWYSRDVIAIASARGLGATAPFFIDADARANPGGLPVGGLTVVAFHNSHLVYAITWFALAALCLFGARLAARRP
jgi:surfeit locus 1 family protein